MSTCPITFVRNNAKYIAGGIAALVALKIISNLASKKCCGKKKVESTEEKKKDAESNGKKKASLDAVVFSGPSGVGKGTLIKKIRDMHPTKFAFSVSHTTRDRREGEVDGVHYHFVKRDVMEKMIENGEFLEACNVHGNLYGTSKAALQSVSDSGKIAIIEMDVQGAQKLKKQQGDLNFYYIFISADENELERRLTARGTDDAERIKTRMTTAKSENEFINENPNFYDQVVVNDDLEATANKIINLLAQQGASF